jgi:hypothetical protein
MDMHFLGTLCKAAGHKNSKLITAFDEQLMLAGTKERFYFLNF